MLLVFLLLIPTSSHLLRLCTQVVQQDLRRARWDLSSAYRAPRLKLLEPSSVASPRLYMSLVFMLILLTLKAVSRLSSVHIPVLWKAPQRNTRTLWLAELLLRRRRKLPQSLYSASKEKKRLARESAPNNSRKPRSKDCWMNIVSVRRSVSRMNKTVFASRN